MRIEALAVMRTGGDYGLKKDRQVRRYEQLRNSKEKEIVSV